MIRSSKNKAAAKSKAKDQKAEELLARNKEKASIVIQCAVRRFVAKARVKRKSREVWLRVFDPSFKIYFWYNRMDKTSRWNIPTFSLLFEEEDKLAVAKIQKVVRGFIGRMKARKIVWQKYGRLFDAKTSKFYWVDYKTGKTTYNASNWLTKQAIPLSNEDSIIYQSQQRIRELEEKLKEKEKEIKDVRKKRYEELEGEVILDKVATAKTLKRSKNMHEWKTEDLAAWFTELKMEEYVQNLFSNR
jgi:hypothetical protein